MIALKQHRIYLKMNIPLIEGIYLEQNTWQFQCPVNYKLNLCPGKNIQVNHMSQFTNHQFSIILIRNEDGGL